MRLVHRVVIPMDARILAVVSKEADELGAFDDDALSVNDALESILHDREEESQEMQHNAH